MVTRDYRSRRNCLQSGALGLQALGLQALGLLGVRLTRR